MNNLDQLQQAGNRLSADVKQIQPILAAFSDEISKTLENARKAVEAYEKAFAPMLKQVEQLRKLTATNERSFSAVLGGISKPINFSALHSALKAPRFPENNVVSRYEPPCDPNPFENINLN